MFENPLPISLFSSPVIYKGENFYKINGMSSQPTYNCNNEQLHTSVISSQPLHSHFTATSQPLHSHFTATSQPPHNPARDDSSSHQLCSALLTLRFLPHISSPYGLHPLPCLNQICLSFKFHSRIRSALIEPLEYITTNARARVYHTSFVPMLCKFRYRSFRSSYD